MSPLSRVPLALLAVASVAFAGPKDELAAATAAADLPKLFSILESAKDAELRAGAEFHFAATLRARKLPVCASIYFATILKVGDKHPFYLPAVEQVIQLQAELDDQVLLHLVTSSMNDAWKRLPLTALSRARFLSAQLAYRKNQLAEVAPLVDLIDPKQPIYLKALYLKAIAAALIPGGTKVPDAIEALEKIVDSKDSTQEHVANVRGLATLALARLVYGQGRYSDSAALYEKARAFPLQRSEAIFESAFARWQNKDVAGALEAARASGSSEAVWLEGTILFFSGRYAEAREALEKSPAAPTVRNGWIAGAIAGVEQVEREKQLIASTVAWKGTPMVRDLAVYLTQNGDQRRYLRDKRVEHEARDRERTERMYRGFAELVRFEIGLAEGGNLDPAIDSLKKIITSLEEGTPVKAELLFHLACLYREKGLQPGRPPKEAALYASETQRVLGIVLRQYPAYERIAEVREMRDELTR